MIDQARLLTLNAACMMDTVGNKAAQAEIAMIKVVAPNMACKVVDWAIQAHGGGGVSEDFWLAEAYAHRRTVRIVDGPDEVHRNAIAKIELGKARVSGQGPRGPLPPERRPGAHVAGKEQSCPRCRRARPQGASGPMRDGRAAGRIPRRLRSPMSTRRPALRPPPTVARRRGDSEQRHAASISVSSTLAS